ncbi:MAG: hypothetical protein KF735_08535 [Chelatococcus sp.]|nr:hypothetical protein [Chelatococcus sp.]
MDPGLSGALAFYFPATPDRVIAEDVPCVNGRIDGTTLGRRIRQLAPTLAIIETVHSMPGQGVASMFKFGQAFGSVLGVIEDQEIPSHLVASGMWKRHFRLSADKEASRDLALRLFPATAEHFARKKHHGRAEAALIARYGAEIILRRPA